MHPNVTELLHRNTDHARRFHTRFDELQSGQLPAAVTVCCSDARVLQDHMWGNDEPGQLFTCSNIGNRVIQRSTTGDVVAGDVLYPLVHTATDVIIVVGHTGCGAITAAYDTLRTGDGSEPPGISHCLDLITPPLEAGVEALPSGVTRTGAVNRLVEYNVDRQIDFLSASDDVPEPTTIVGAVYDFQDVYSGRRGEVHLINVDGETSVAELRAQHPEVDSRIERLWQY